MRCLSVSLTSFALNFTLLPSPSPFSSPSPPCFLPFLPCFLLPPQENLKMTLSTEAKMHQWTEEIKKACVEMH